MRKNLMDKMMNSHNNDNDDRQGTWLYAGHEVAGYLTSNGEYLDMRPKGDTNESTQV